MPFFRVPMHADSAGREAPYAFVIIEDEDDCGAYDSALGLPTFLGDATDDGVYDMPAIVEVSDPVCEPWPIFTTAYFKREREESAARVEEMFRSGQLIRPD